MKNARKAIALGLLAITLAGCGGSDGSQELEDARREGVALERARQQELAKQREQQRLQRRIDQLERQQRADRQQRRTPVASSSGGGTTCSSGLAVGPNTSCPFAEEVRSAWYGAGGGNATLNVYSPVTGRYYTMSCAAGITTVCRGGNNASVYIG